jgi:hypothetical protein
MSNFDRFCLIFGWDGVLPLLVAIVPWIVRTIFRAGHIAEVLAAILLPIVLAIVKLTLVPGI